MPGVTDKYDAGLQASIQAAAPSSPEMAALVECRAITDDAARLVCLDREVALLAARVSSGSVVLVQLQHDDVLFAHG